MRTVIGLYESLVDAQCALELLDEEGFPDGSISLVAGDPNGAIAREIHGIQREDQEHAENPMPPGFAESLDGLRPQQTADAGAVLAAGPLLNAMIAFSPASSPITDVPASSLTRGELTAALESEGINAEDAAIYAQEIARGGALMLVVTDARFAERAAVVMNRCRPVDVDRLLEESGQIGLPVTGENRDSAQPSRTPNHIRSYLRPASRSDWGNP